jgi:glycosyltransferase involved in cell wall biosynthesis
MLMERHQDDIRDSAICVIPIYNEAQVLSKVISDLRTYLPNILCVDDGSTDGSAKIAENAGARVIRHCMNIGQGGALQTAFRILSKENKFKYVVTYDADGQHRPQDAFNVVKKLVDSRVDVVFASRFLMGDKSQIPVMKRIMLRSVVRFNQWTTDVNLTDTHNGLRAVRLSALSNFSFRHFGMAHATEFVSQTIQSNLAFTEMPVTVVYTEYSKQKGQSALNSINILLDFLWR